MIVKCSLDDMSDYAAISPDMVLLANPSSDTFDPVAALAQRCLNIKACAEAMLENPTPLWVIFSGALESTSSEIRPVETGAWAFSRTLANEFRKLDVRRIDVALGTDPADTADQIVRIMLSGTPETELLVDDTTIRAVRVQELGARGRIADRDLWRSAAALKRRTGPGARVSWQPIKRVKPRATEVEIAVEATGLNFRDLMWTLGLLPDDMLEDGFTGPTLGLECAGRVVRVGQSVDNFATRGSCPRLGGFVFRHLCHRLRCAGGQNADWNVLRWWRHHPGGVPHGLLFAGDPCAVAASRKWC